jgi:hypothetical protein
MSQKARFLIAILVVLLIVITSILLAVTINSSPKEDQGIAVDHDGSVETALSVQHADSAHDVVLTTHKVWVRSRLYATLVHRDTIPALDSLSTTAENSAGVTQQVRLKKDYQLFITVK